MVEATSLLDRRLYGLAQVDRLLTLNTGTARRWIQGYDRGGKEYPPVVRPERNDDDIVTWGEFVETRLLAEYRGAGVPMVRMRPAIMRLRETLETRFPLATAHPFLDVAGRELVLRIQNEVDLERSLQLVVVRNGQVVLTDQAEEFVRSVDYGDGGAIATSIRPLSGASEVVVDPLRQFGQPVVRSVPTEVIAELVRAGDRIQMIAELYDLTTDEVEAAVRFELVRTSGSDKAA